MLKLNSSLSAFSLLALLFCFCRAKTEVRNTTFQVGVILDSESLIGRICLTSLSLALSDFYSADTNRTTKLVLHVKDSNGNVIDAAASALSLLKDVEVDAIFGPQTSAEANFVARLGDRANVPIISFSATSPFLRPQFHPYFFQAAISDSAQVGAIADVIEYFKWKQLVLVYEESDSGIVPYLSNKLPRISYKSVIPNKATDDFILQELYKMKTMETRVFVVHVSNSLASRLFLKVKEAGMMSEGYAWILTSGVMDLLHSLDSRVVESMEGVIGVKPLITKSRNLSSVAKRWKMKFLHDNPEFSQVELGLYGLWAYDALWALAMAAERVQFRDPSHSHNTSRTGRKLREAMSEVTFQGLGGQFHFVNRHLEPPSYQILNVVGNAAREVGIWTPFDGILSERNTNVSSNSLNRKMKSVIFPGDSTIMPKGWEVPVSGKKLRIGVPVASGFPEFVNIVKDPQTNASVVRGCYIDMFDAVIAAMPYALRYEYVPFEKFDGSSAGSKYELIYHVFLQDYDGAVGDISITLNRSKYVDFTLPFTAGGVDMVVQTTDDDSNGKWFFLKPLKKELWLIAITLFVLTGFALWILEHRFNGAYRGPPSQHAGMIFYVPFMSLVYAQRERIVNNLARLVVVVWMFVVLILNSTYTASLSARLTVQRLQPVVTDANELIRKGEYVGFHNGSFIYDLLQKIGFDKSKIRAYELPEHIDEALTKGTENGGISALFSTRPYTNLFLSKYCRKYTIVGPTYPTEGFAYMFQRGSPIVADVSRAVIELTENGKLSDIEGQWMKHGECNGQDNSVSSSISLRSFQTLFGITGGITAACVLVFIGKYLYENMDFIRRISNSSTTIWSKIRAICKHFDQRDPKSFPSRKDKEDGSNTPPGSSIIVPVSFVEMNDTSGDGSQSCENNSQHSENVTRV